MPSIIPGYEYDIFISYRQKDNKRDGWVIHLVKGYSKLGGTWEYARVSLKSTCT